MMPEKAPVVEQPTEKAPRQRSPNYPGISLESAVEKISAWFRADGIVSSSRQSAMKHMGGGDEGRVFSALKSFGLISEEEGKIKLTQRGIDIVARKPDEQKRQQALKDAATGPPIYLKLINEFPDGLPSDTTLESELVASKGFNPKAVASFLKDFRSALEFSGISDFAAVNSGNEDHPKADEEPPPTTKIKIGDFVQWESGGMLQFPIPRRVTGFANDEYANVEGSNTGIRIKELSVLQSPTAPLTPVQPLPMMKAPAPEQQRRQPERPELRDDTFSLPEGNVMVRFPSSLSPESFQDLSAWLDILKRKIGRSVPFKATKRDVIAKLRAGFSIDGDPVSDTPCGLIDPTQTAIDSCVLISAEMFRELLDDGILQDSPGTGRRLFKMA